MGTVYLSNSEHSETGILSHWVRTVTLQIGTSNKYWKQQLIVLFAFKYSTYSSCFSTLLYIYIVNFKAGKCNHFDK